MAGDRTTGRDARTIGLALLRFAVVYAAAFALWIPLAVQRPVWLLPLATAATVAAPAIETPNLTTRVEAEAQRLLVLGEDSTSGRTYRFTIKAHPFSHGVPVLLALIAAVPGLSAAVRARVVVGALGPLFAVDLLLLLCAVQNGYLGVTGPAAPALDRSLAFIFRAGTDAAEAFFGQFVSVVVVFGAALTMVLRREARRGPGGPNARCGCGSGLKRKRCCGV